MNEHIQFIHTVYQPGVLEIIYITQILNNKYVLRVTHTMLTFYHHGVDFFKVCKIFTLNLSGEHVAIKLEADLD